MEAMNPDKIVENKAILEEVALAYNEGRIEDACSFTHPECTLNGEIFGREGDLGRSFVMQTAFPDQVWHWDYLIAEGEWVSAAYTFKGTFLGNMGDVPPNGKEIVFTGVSLYHFIDGLIVEIKEYYDKLGLYQQMGLIPG
jgi:predicted ester cyclase